MNTANLQLEGLLVAISSLVETMRRKGLLTQQEIEDALSNAEAAVGADPQRPPEVSASNVDAICFPIRFLKLAMAATPGSHMFFSETTAMVGETKPDRYGIPAG